MSRDSGGKSVSYSQKSCLRNHGFRPMTAPASLGQGQSNFYGVGRKSVSFSPDTRIIERQCKYSKSVRDMRRKSKLVRELANSFPSLESEEETQEHEELQLYANRSSTTKLQKICDLYGVKEIRETLYVKFTGRKEAISSKEVGIHVVGKKIRVQRLFKVLSDLQKAHDEHPNIPLSLQGTHLHEQIFKRHVIALDLALTENILDISREVLSTIVKTTRYVIEKRKQGMFENTQTKKVGLQTACQFVRCLNQISDEKSRYDMTFMRLESICVKLIFELLLLTVCSSFEVLYDRVLNVIPVSGEAAIERISEMERSGLACCWENNSEVRKDYETFLSTLGFTDMFGCKDNVTPYHRTLLLSQQSSESFF